MQTNQAACSAALHTTYYYPTYSAHPRDRRCFSPDNTPGVSMMLISLSTGESVRAASNLFKKPPKAVKPAKGKSLTAVTALP